MKPVIFHAAAADELQAALAHYEGQRAGLGAELRAAVEAAILKVQQEPAATPTVGPRGARKSPMRRFPFALFYADRDDAIWILAVAHQHLKPGYWTARNG